MQQATVNLFADMGVQPHDADVRARRRRRASTDTTPPTSTITSPAAGANLQDGTTVTITGTATDTGGGVVAGVEVSTDGGTTWHPATMTGAAATSGHAGPTRWIAHGSPLDHDQVARGRRQRQPRDAGRRRSRSTSTARARSGAPSVTPPTRRLRRRARRSTVGVKFTVRHLRADHRHPLLQGATNTGTHVGSLWSSDGKLLASATFTNETRVRLADRDLLAVPSRSCPNTTYVAGYFAPIGHYAATDGYFYPPPGPDADRRRQRRQPAAARARTTTPRRQRRLHLRLARARSRRSSFGAANYWVDVMFAPAPAPGQVTNVTATRRQGHRRPSPGRRPTTGGPVTTYTITPYIGSTAQTPTTVNGTPPATTATITGLTAGHDLHVHRARRRTRTARAQLRRSPTR